MQQEQLNAEVNDFVLAIRLLAHRMRAAGGTQEISETQASVMARLASEGSETISNLARAESLRPQTMGSTIAALEELGLVERKPHPTDGRQVNIVLTAEGATARNRMRAAKRAWLAEAMTQLDDEEQQIIFRAGRIIKRMVES